MKAERSQTEERSESGTQSAKSQNVEQAVHQTAANVTLQTSSGCSKVLRAEHPGLPFKKCNHQFPLHCLSD